MRSNNLVLSTVELAQARDVVSSLLEQLELSAYLFEVEPREGQWEIRVECALLSNGWQTVTLVVDKTQLIASQTDDIQREQLLAEWRTQLAACKVTPKRPS